MFSATELQRTNVQRSKGCKIMRRNDVNNFLFQLLKRNLIHLANKIIDDGLITFYLLV